MFIPTSCFVGQIVETLQFLSESFQKYLVRALTTESCLESGLPGCQYAKFKKISLFQSGLVVWHFLVFCNGVSEKKTFVAIFKTRLF